MTTRRIATPSRRAMLAGAAAVPALSLAGAGLAQADGAYHDAAGLKIAAGYPKHYPNKRSVDFMVHTPKVQTFPPSFRVTLPEGYEASPTKRYPVIVLLHGHPSNYTQWTDDLGAVKTSAGHDVILVSPDGGAGSFYSNANFPAWGRQAAWETFIMEQVLGFVHENFRTDSQRMAIAGLSMGGWGALALGQRYYGHFRSVSSYSGPADCWPTTAGGLGVALAIMACPASDNLRYPGSNFPGTTWGLDPAPAIAHGYNPMDNIEKYRGKRVFLRTGDGPWGDVVNLFDRFVDVKRQVRDASLPFLEGIPGDVGEAFSGAIESAVYSTQERFSHALSDAGIDNDFAIARGHNHEGSEWTKNFAEDLPGIMAALNA